MEAVDGSQLKVKKTEWREPLWRDGERSAWRQEVQITLMIFG